jgi:Flp pilus assembly protein TadG
MKIISNNRLTSSGSKRRGAAVIEAALVLPVVVLFLFGILEYGRYLMFLQVFTNAAREGAHYALAHTDPITISGTTSGNATSDVTNAVNNALAGQKLTNQNVQVYASDSLGNNLGTWTTGQAGQSVCVRITGNYPVIIPNLLHLASSVPVVAQAVMRSEGN